MGRKIKFVKSHGLGNDFILIEDLREELELSQETVARLCNRHFGIGSDGLILIRPSREGDFFMKFFNADGSEAEMCGNGIRCFAKYLFDHKLVNRTNVYIETLAGLKEVKLIFIDGTPRLARVDMGQPSFKPHDFHALSPNKEMIDYEIDTVKGKIKMTCLSIGNPHCVIFAESVDLAPVHSLGPLVEKLPLFSQRTNVEFVQILNPNRIKVRVWERGAGETLACGTGACAAAVAAAKAGYTSRKVTVQLPGGELEIEWTSDDHIFLTGPAEEVFEGDFDLSLFETLLS